MYIKVYSLNERICILNLESLWSCWCPGTSQAATTMWSSSWLLMPWHQPSCHHNVIIFVATDALAPAKLPPQCDHLRGYWCPGTSQAATTMWSSLWLLMPWHHPICHHNVIIFVAADALAPHKLPPLCGHLCGCWCPVNVIIFVAADALSMWSSLWLLMPCQCDHLCGCWCPVNVIIFVVADALSMWSSLWLLMPCQCDHLCGCWCPVNMIIFVVADALSIWSSLWLLMPCQYDHLCGCWCPVNVIVFVVADALSIWSSLWLLMPCQGISSYKDDHIVMECTLALSSHFNHCFNLSANIVPPPKSFPPSTSCNIQPIPLTSHPSWPLCDMAFIAGIIPVTVYEHIAAAAASDSLISTRATTDDSWH